MQPHFFFNLHFHVLEALVGVHGGVPFVFQVFALVFIVFMHM